MWWCKFKDVVCWITGKVVSLSTGAHGDGWRVVGAPPFKLSVPKCICTCLSWNVRVNNVNSSHHLVRKVKKKKKHCLIGSIFRHCLLKFRTTLNILQSIIILYSVNVKSKRYTIKKKTYTPAVKLSYITNSVRRIASSKKRRSSKLELTISCKRNVEVILKLVQFTELTFSSVTQSASLVL